MGTAAPRIIDYADYPALATGVGRASRRRGHGIGETALGQSIIFFVRRCSRPARHAIDPPMQFPLKRAIPLLAACCFVAHVGRGAAWESESVPRPEHPRPQLERPEWLNLNGRWQFRFDDENRGLREQWPRLARWPSAAGGAPEDAKASGARADNAVAIRRELPTSIVVPFPWQSELSGVADRSGRKIGWYRRSVKIPADWRGRHVWLCFGAVDHEARVWVNGRAAGRHEGGYTPFAFDVTEHVAPGEEAVIDVRAFDATAPDVPVGLQGPPWFTPSSGIWQTVYLEARPERHVEQLKLTPVLVSGEWVVEAEVGLAGADGAVDVRIDSPSPHVREVQRSARIEDGAGTCRTMIGVDRPRCWTPEDPHLYPIEVVVTDADGGRDVVRSYFGLRQLRRGAKGDSAYEMLLLNGTPVFLRGAVDPGFYPGGLYTAPSDGRLRADIEAAKRLGLNILRTRVKALDPRKLYWADRLGLMIWPEMPSTHESSPKARGTWERTMRAVIARDVNHPSIVGWTLFHNGWGLGEKWYRRDQQLQDWVAEMVEVVRGRLDPSRLIEDMASGEGDHVETDVNSWQFRIDDYWIAREHINRVISRTRPGSPALFVPGRRQGTAPLVCSQFGAIAPGGVHADVSWSFRYLVTQLRRHDLLQGMYYASLYDVEWRHDGLLHADRSPKVFGYEAFAEGMGPSDLLGEDFVGVDAPPMLQVAPGEQVALSVFAAHYSTAPGPPRLAWRITGTDQLGRPVDGGSGSRPAVWEHGTVSFQQPLRVRMPGTTGMIGAIELELLDASDRRVAVNYVNLLIDHSGAAESDGGSTLVDRGTAAGQISSAIGQVADASADVTTGLLDRFADSPRVEVLGRELVVVRFAPREFAKFRTDRLGWDWLTTEGKFHAYGNCEVEYHLALPEFIRDALPTKVVLMAEMATRADASPINSATTFGAATAGGSPAWQAGTNRSGPARTFPGRVEVSSLGNALCEFPLPDDPADSRGVLSHHRRFHHGSYGYLSRKLIDLREHPQVREAIYEKPYIPLVFRSGSDGAGLSIYGHRLGRYVIDPTLIIQTSRPLRPRKGLTSFRPVTVNRLLDRARVVEGIRGTASSGHPWRYATEPPSPEWTTIDFDDSDWPVEQFHPPRQQGPVALPSPPIWLRTDFQLEATPVGFVLRYRHDEDVRIFLNGTQLIHSTGHCPAVVEHPLDREELKLLHIGKNVLAVQGHRTRGGPGVELDARWIEIVPDADGENR